ncbi:MAG TPA: hypothetical protein VMF88_11380 [Bacteroidota bacterium]|nr:hypothetical protein [Bacteroidota bacterium]
MSIPVKLILAAIVCFMPSAMPQTVRAEGIPRTNEEILTMLSKQAADDFCEAVNIPDTTALDVIEESGEVNRFFFPPLLEAFRRHFTLLYTRSGVSSVELRISGAQAAVHYGQSFSDGFFSARKCSRELSVSFRFSAIRAADGKVLLSATHARAFSDTVNVDEISKLQESSKQVASASLPERSAFERFIAPLIIAGAAGVAVYLFFTIRS